MEHDAAEATCDETDCPIHGLVLFSTPNVTRVIQSFSPVGALPGNPTNRYADDPRAAQLGQKLFFEKRYAGMITGRAISGRSARWARWRARRATTPPTISRGADDRYLEPVG